MHSCSVFGLRQVLVFCFQHVEQGCCIRVFAEHVGVACHKGKRAQPLSSSCRCRHHGGVFVAFMPHAHACPCSHHLEQSRVSPLVARQSCGIGSVHRLYQVEHGARPSYHLFGTGVKQSVHFSHQMFSHVFFFLCYHSIFCW